MDEALEKPRPLLGWVVKLLIVMMALSGGFFLYDISQFAYRCFYYARQVGQISPRISDEVSEVEAIVVLTGDRNRIPRALELLRVRKSPLLIISGVTKGVSLKALVNQQGDATVKIHEIWDRIILESNSSSTIENAIETSRLLLEHGTKKVILMTSDYHMERARKIFEEIIPSVEYFTMPVSSDFTELLAPNGFTLAPQGVWKFFVEYWKHALYSTHLLTTSPLELLAG